jgi:hypothetical protein
VRLASSAFALRRGGRRGLRPLGYYWFVRNDGHGRSDRRRWRSGLLSNCCGRCRGRHEENWQFGFGLGLGVGLDLGLRLRDRFLVRARVNPVWFRAGYRVVRRGLWFTRRECLDDRRDGRFVAAGPFDEHVRRAVREWRRVISTAERGGQWLVRIDGCRGVERVKRR